MALPVKWRSTPSRIREIGAPRYVGQTRNPLARYAQHFHSARLWLPDELPWWVKRPDLRPLYIWMRELHADERRLPVMFIVGWTSVELALNDERRFIRAYLSDGLALLNVEAERSQRVGPRSRRNRATG